MVVKKWLLKNYRNISEAGLYLVEIGIDIFDYRVWRAFRFPESHFLQLGWLFFFRKHETETGAKDKHE